MSTSQRIRYGLTGALMALTAFAAQAQDSSNRVAANSDWSVFVEDNPTECWGVSAPKKTVNSRNGKVVEVRRGDILLFVSYRPGQSVKGEISFTGGYPFASGSTVKMQIGDKSYDFFTEGEWAWPASEADQAAIMTAMKGGAEAVATGVSSRGTTTKDTFSLMGFTAAVNEAARRCGG